MHVSTLIRQLTLASLTGAILASSPAIASSDAGTITVKASPGGNCHQQLSGFDSGIFGSYSPTGLTGGETVISLVDSIFLMPGCGDNFSGFSCIWFLI
jgi:hypothetical protein